MPVPVHAWVRFLYEEFGDSEGDFKLHSLPTLALSPSTGSADFAPRFVGMVRSR